MGSGSREAKLQNVWFLLVCHFHSRTCKKKKGLQVGTATVNTRVIPLLLFSQNGILIAFRCRSLREEIHLFYIFSIYFILLLRRNGVKKGCQNVCQENSVWEYREGPSAGSCMLFRVGQRRRAGRKTWLIAVLTEIHKRDRSYQA